VRVYAECSHLADFNFATANSTGSKWGEMVAIMDDLNHVVSAFVFGEIHVFVFLKVVGKNTTRKGNQ